MKKKKDFKTWFIISSFIYLTVLVLIYGGRFIYFYKITHTEKKVGDTLLSTVILNLSNTQTINGIMSDTNGKYYKGGSLSNYVYYSGRYFRIMSIKDGNITLVEDNISTILPHNNNDYKLSDINLWLNKNGENTGIYYDSLDSPESYLIKTKTCLDSYIKGDVTCNDYIEDYIGTLSINDYLKADSTSNYLDNNSFYLLANKAQEDMVWYVNNKGELLTTEDTSNYGVRAVITLNSNVLYYGGTGTYYEPYTFTKKDAYILANTDEEVVDKTLLSKNIGTYLKFNDYIWRINDKTEDNVGIILNESLVTKPFSLKTNVFNLSDRSGIAYYLNNEFYNSLNNKDYIISNKWYIGEYSNSYTDKYTDTVSAYIGLPSIGDLFINDVKNTLTLTTASRGLTIYKVIDGRFYADDYKNEFEIRPTLYLDGKIEIKSGHGTLDNPYQVGEV